LQPFIGKFEINAEAIVLYRHIVFLLAPVKVLNLIHGFMKSYRISSFTPWEYRKHSL